MAKQTEVEQQTGPGSAAPATQQPASVVAAKKERQASKKTLALMQAQREAGYSEGLNARSKEPSGLPLWLLIAFVVGYVLHDFVAKWHH